MRYAGAGFKSTYDFLNSQAILAGQTSVPGITAVAGSKPYSSKCS